MKKNLFIGALAVFALTACSQDEVVEVNNHGNEIQFSVVANKGSRAANLWCNQSLFTQFTATAGIANDANFTGANNTSYFENLTFAPKDGTWQTTTTHYWPEEETLNIYAIAGDNDNTIVMNASGAKLSTDFEVNSIVASQEDLVYAADLGVANPKNGQTVPLNFRHALSQIVFKGKVTNPHLYVEVSEVAIHNVYSKGNIAWTASTEEKFGNHNGVNDDATSSQASYESLVWTYTGDDTADFSTVVKEDAEGSKKVRMANDKSGEKVYNWTEETDATHAETTGEGAAKYTNPEAMLLIPNYALTDANKTTYYNAWNGTDGAYIAVKCAIYHVAEPQSTTAEDVTTGGFNATTDVAAWGEQDAHKWIVIPADLKWEPGKKYVYTINFGIGNGGYKPDPEDPDKPTTEPVLTPISFSVSVDDFDVVPTPEIDSNTQQK